MRTLVVIPTYNEAATIARAVAGALAADPAVDVLVVDDASPDGTAAAVADLAAAGEGRVHLLERREKRGLGGAYLAGFAWGLERGYEALAEMDADLSHDPADLPRLVAALAGADLVIGSRYVPGGGVRDWPRRRLALSRAGNRYVRAVTGLPVADATAGYRVFRRAALQAVDLDDVSSDGYAFQVEMALRVWRGGFRIVEVPITFTERREGASKMSRDVITEALWRVPAWGVEGPRGPRTVHPRSIGATARPNGAAPGKVRMPEQFA